VWPRLAPGVNEIIVSGSGIGSIEFTYRYPMKIADCVIDIYVSNDNCNCSDNTSYGIVAWNDVVDTPTTIDGYGITDVYTESEIDYKFENISVECDATVDGTELNNMLADVLGE